MDHYGFVTLSMETTFVRNYDDFVWNTMGVVSIISRV